MKEEPFYTSKFYVRRAKKHVEEFIRVLKAWTDAEPYKTVTEFNPTTGENVVKLKLVSPVPEDLQGIVFDAVNSLRASLDSALYVFRHSDSHFPIAGSPEAFETSGVKGRCGGVPQEIIDVIRGFKPYKGGNNLIWAMNKLCNTNKHATVCPATTGAVQSCRQRKRRDTAPHPRLESCEKRDHTRPLPAGIAI